MSNINGSFGLNDGFEEGLSFVIEKGICVNGEHFILEDYTDSEIPILLTTYNQKVSEIFENLPQEIINDFGLTNVWQNNSKSNIFQLDEYGLHLKLLIMPFLRKSIAFCTTWNWYGNRLIQTKKQLVLN
ncbi:MAG: hypothetical protein R2764_12830 [Bacteroidales bacterium]